MKSTMENPDTGPDPIMGPDSTIGPDPTMGPSKKKMYTCNYCPLDYMARNDYRTHVQKIHGKMTYVCESCPRVFHVEKELWDHMKSTHKGMKRHFCSQCPRSYKTRMGLAHHFNSKHKIEKAVECNKCGKEFHNSYSFRKHLQLKHKPNQVYYKCNKCSRSFKYRYLLNQHMEFDHTKNGKQKLLNYMKELNVDKSLTSDATQCKSCKIKFKCSIDLIEHLKSNHARKVKKFSCCQCKEAVYMSRSALGIHMRYDHGLLNHSCSKCPPAQRPTNTAPLKKKKPKLKSKQKEGSTVPKLNKKTRLQVNDGSMLHLFNVNINSPTIKLSEKVTKTKAPWADKFIKENLPSDIELDNATNQQLENLRHNIRTAFHTLSTVPPSKLKSSMVSRFLNNTSGQNIMQKHVSVLSIMFPSMTPSVQMASISDIQPSDISVSGSKKSPLKSSDKPNVTSSNSKIRKSNFSNKVLKNNSAPDPLFEPIVSITDILKNVEPNITNFPKEKKRKRINEEAMEIDKTVHSNKLTSECVNESEVTVTTNLPKEIAMSVPFKKRKLNNIERTSLLRRDDLNTKKNDKTDTEAIERSKLLESKSSVQLYRIPKIAVTDLKKEKLYINTEKRNRSSGDIKSISPANTQQTITGKETFTNTSNKDLNTSDVNAQTVTISSDVLAVSQACYTTSEIHLSSELVNVKSRVPPNVKNVSSAAKNEKSSKRINAGVLKKQTKARDANTYIENTRTKVPPTDVPLILQEGKTTNKTNMSLKSQSVNEDLLNTVLGKKALKASRKDDKNKYIHPDSLKKQFEAISADFEPTSQKSQNTEETHKQVTSPSVKDKSAVTADCKKSFETPRKDKQSKDVNTLNTQVKIILEDVAPTSQKCHNNNESHTQFTLPSLKEKSAVTPDCIKAIETPRKDKQSEGINILNTQVKIILEDVPTLQESQNINEIQTQFTSPSVTIVTTENIEDHKTPRKDKQSNDKNTLNMEVETISEDVAPSLQECQNENETHTPLTAPSLNEKSAVTFDPKKTLKTLNKNKHDQNLNDDIEITQENVNPTGLPLVLQICCSASDTQTSFKSTSVKQKTVDVIKRVDIVEDSQQVSKTPKQEKKIKGTDIKNTQTNTLSTDLPSTSQEGYSDNYKEKKIKLLPAKEQLVIDKKHQKSTKTLKKNPSKIKKKVFSTPKIKLGVKLDSSECNYYNKPLPEAKISLEKVSSTSNILEKTVSISKTEKNELEKHFSRSLLKLSKTDVEKSKHRHATKNRELPLSKRPSHSSEKSLEQTGSLFSVNEKSYNKVKPTNKKSSPKVKSSSDNLKKADDTSSQATTSKREIVSKEVKHAISDTIQKSTEVKHDDRQMKIEPSQENPITDSSVSSPLLLNKIQDQPTDSLSGEEKRKSSNKTKSSKSQKCDDNKKDTATSLSNKNANVSSTHSSQDKKEATDKTNTTTQPSSVEDQLLILFNESVSSPKSPPKKRNCPNNKPLQSEESVLESITATTATLQSSSTRKSHNKNKEKSKHEDDVNAKLTSTSTSQDNKKQKTDDKLSASRDSSISSEKSPKTKQTSDDTKVDFAPNSPSNLDNNMNDSSNSEKLSIKKVTELPQETSMLQESQETLLSKEKVKGLLNKHTSPEKKIPVRTKVVSPLKKAIVIPTGNKVIMPDAGVTPLHTIDSAKIMYSPTNKDYCTNITNRILITNDILIKPHPCVRKVPSKNFEGLTKVTCSPTPKTQMGSVNTTNTVSDKQGSTGVESTISILEKPPTPAIISVIEPDHTNAHKHSPKKSRSPHKSSKDDNRRETDLVLLEKILTSPCKKIQNENAATMIKNKHNEISVEPKTPIFKLPNDRCLKDLKIILHRCDEIITGNGKTYMTENHKDIVLSTENENKHISTSTPGQINYEQGIPDDDYHLSVDSTFCLPEPQFAEVQYDETGLNVLEVANYVDVETTSSPIHSNTNSPVPMIASPVKAYMCAYCSVKFIDEISLLNHLTEEHAYNNENDSQVQPSKTLYKCGTCGSGFREKDILDKHVKEQHTDTNAYNCKQCTAVFLYKYNLKKHIRKVHSTMINTICEICKMEFTSLKALQEHHCCASSDEQDILVDVVTVDEETNKKLPAHAEILPAHEEILPTHEEILPAHEEILPAHEEILPAHEEILPAHKEISLSSSYEDKMDLSGPLTKAVNDEVPVNEPKPPVKKLVRFSDVINEQIVEQKFPLVHKISKKTKKHRCDVCKSNLPSGLSLFNHTRLLHKHTILKCNMCKLEFLNPVNFKQHVCKSETKFECKKCKLVFPSKELLLEHRREKHNLGTLKCDYCSKYLKSNQNLIKHITLRHMDRSDYKNMTKQTKKSRNTKQFSSDIYDDLKIINEASVKNYITNEEESLFSNKLYSQKLHKCDICKRKFSSERDLISHTKVKHKQCRYYKCLKCSRKFSQRVLLLKHIKYVHKIEPNKLHRCTECSAVFKFEDKLLQHHKLKHNKTENRHPKTEVNINRNRRVMSKPMRYVAPNASPIRAPNASPIRGPNASPIRAPNASPKRESSMTSVVAPSSEISTRKIYKCNECSATLPTSESLQRHMQWEHMKGHKCGICGEVLDTAEEFLRHLMFGHANEKINEVLPTPLALPESSFKWKTHLAYKHERQAE